MIIKHTWYIGGQAFKTIVEWCKNEGLNPEHFLRVLFCESGLNPLAAAKNSSGTIVAAGLNQIVPGNFAGLGWQGDARNFLLLGADGQLPYVFRYFKPYLGYGLDSPAAIYACNFLPGRIGMAGWKQSGHVLCSKGGELAWAYEANKMLDMDKDGHITIGDLDAWQQSRCRGEAWNEVMQRLQEALGKPGPWGWKKIQEELIKLGAEIRADGVPGPKTALAVQDIIGKYVELSKGQGT